MEGRVGEAETREQVHALNGFYYHFVIFAAMLGVLAAINLATSNTFWVHWVLLGWGIGILFHGYMAFVRVPQRIAERKERLAARRARAA